MKKKYNAFTLAEGATHAGMSKNYGKIAFTLAEVLITLGIIGVVASVTIPAIINNHRSQALKASFLKTYSLLANATELAKIDLNLFSVEKEFSDEFAEALQKRLNVTDIKTNLRFYPYINKHKAINYSNTTPFNSCLNSKNTKEYILNNGASYCVADGGGFAGADKDLGYVIGFDTNGPYKGPNRAGYDVFDVRFNSDSIEPYYFEKTLNYCTKTNNPDASNDWYGTGGGFSHQSNGRFCAYWALKDVNPDKRDTSYWKSLY